MVQVGNVQFGNDQPLGLIAGINVIESRDLALRVAEHFKALTTQLGIPYVFKASFDKANRSSVSSFRGPGLDAGLAVLQEVAATFDVPVVTDVHEQSQVAPAAEVCHLLQLPAFLARQTDLVESLAGCGVPVHVKKPQFMSPEQTQHVVGKFAEFGNSDRVMLCERGTSFGYDTLVVDMLGFRAMKELPHAPPVTFDVTHALQTRAVGGAASGGRRRQVLELARAGIAVGIAGLFLEAHPNPDEALCDGPSALPLDRAEAFLTQIKQVDDLIKSLPELVID